jgi:hypothetical protein
MEAVLPHGENGFVTRKAPVGRGIRWLALSAVDRTEPLTQAGLWRARGARRPAPHRVG